MENASVSRANSGGVRQCCKALRMPLSFKPDKVARTNKIRACHVSKLLVLTTSFQGIQ